MSTQTIPARPTVAGHAIDTSKEVFGTLSPTPPDADAATLHERMDRDGYLYLPGFFDRAQVLEVRRSLLVQLSAMGLLVEGSDPMDALLRPGVTLPTIEYLNAKLAVHDPGLKELLYGARTMQFWEAFLGGPVLHFDFTWLRVTPPGRGTPAHTDIVFMGRGTQRLYTTWVPYGDVPIDLGGLAVLERGHLHDFVRNDYGVRDVDTFCENQGETATPGPSLQRSLLDEDPEHLRETLGGRWLTTDYAAGDVVVFGMFLPHVGIDNATGDRLRLSSDSRYQLASEAVDERWIGQEPVGHGPGAKVGMIC